MILRPDVDASGLHPSLHLWLGVLAVEHRKRTLQPLTVTSLRRPPGTRPSRHSPTPPELVTAVDVRRWALDELGQAEHWCRMLQHEYGHCIGVVLEPDWLTGVELIERGGRDAVPGHIHVQLKFLGWPDSP